MKYAQNSPKSSKFHRKKRIFCCIRLEFKLNLNIVESMFPIEFQGRSTKNQKLRFYGVSVFLIQRFLICEKYSDLNLIDDLNLTNLFQKVKHYIP